MMNAPFGWLTQCDRHTKSADCQIPFHTITDGPTDDPPRIKIENDSEIQPALAGPEVGDVPCPFLVWTISREVLIQQVRSDVERMVG